MKSQSAHPNNRVVGLLLLAGTYLSSPQAACKERSEAMIKSDYRPGQLTVLCDQAIEEATRALDQLVKLTAEQKTPENTLLEFEKITTDFSDRVIPLTFMNSVSTDEKISQESSKCEEKVSQFSVSIYTRKDLYRILAEQSPKKSEEVRLHKETLEAFEDNGLKLSDEKLEKVKELKQRLASLESQFGTYLNQDNSFIDFSEAELTGVPPDFIHSLEKTRDGQFRVTTKEPHYVRIMENASQPETRHRMLAAYENRAAKENVKRMQDAIYLRSQIAELMGFSSWADYRVHNRMAKNAHSVMTFLEGLKSKLSVGCQKDLKRLLKFKQEQEPKATHLNAWDLRYYDYQLRKRDYQLDDEKIREYFPADVVIQGLFSIYSKLLGIELLEVKNAKVWAEGVKLFEIKNTQDQELIGYFYTDFIPRKGKYGHAAAFTLRSGRKLASGKYNHPISAIVANFSVAEGDRPVSLNHDEVETLFHEFGHIMHQTLTKAPYASLSGSSVDQDFVEAPSQMLENWVYSPEILAELSGHYLDHSKKLPKSLVDQIIKARDFNQNYIYTRQLLFGLFDMSCHSYNEKNSTDPNIQVDPSALYRKLHVELLGIEAVENSQFPASFGHLMGGYDAGYYGYLWSKVYAEDMFTRFEKEGLVNAKVGQDYRRIVLEQGKMVDSFEILEKFLGRKPSTDAFYRKLHIQ